VDIFFLDIRTCVLYNLGVKQPERGKRALIHGLYSGLITGAEQTRIDQLKPTDIEGEIAYLRTVCGRLAKIVEKNGLQSGAVKPLDDRTIRTLNAMDLKLNTLLRYVRAHAYLNGEPNEYDRQIEEGEFLARKRRGVYNYLSAGKETQPGHRSGGLDDA